MLSVKLSISLLNNSHVAFYSLEISKEFFGDYEVDVIYSGDENHNAANLTTYFSFRTLKTDVILNISDADYGRNTTNVL